MYSCGILYLLYIYTFNWLYLLVKPREYITTFEVKLLYLFLLCAEILGILIESFGTSDDLC